MILVGDALEKLREIPDATIQTCVTSPPYWGLRDYGTAQWDGGDPVCTHEPPQEWIQRNFNAHSAFGNGVATQSAAASIRWYGTDGMCPCGARRTDRQIGIEKTPEVYVGKLVNVFREVMRVLKDDGTLWLNLGDSYNGSGQSGGTNSISGKGKSQPGGGILKDVPNLKPKNLVGIPWRVAFALQADGWYLRSDIIWHKPNPMPESVVDRPTKSHEYIFLLTKSAKYYYDADAIKENSIWAHSNPRADGSGVSYGQKNEQGLFKRNRRDVWSITPQPFSGAHFATFPPEIPELCIKAGSSPGDTVLDPFAGSGTTLIVAKKLFRKFIGVELNPKYAHELISPRLADTDPLFSEAAK